MLKTMILEKKWLVMDVFVNIDALYVRLKWRNLIFQDSLVLIIQKNSTYCPGYINNRLVSVFSP